MRCWKGDVDMLGYISIWFQMLTPYDGIDKLGGDRVGCIMMDFG